MSHVIVGAGATGILTARKLAEAGEPVRLVTCSGSGPEHRLVERIAADATNPDALVELSTGARTLINCAAPPYDRWLTDFPPLAAALLEAAERAELDYVMLGNVYAYGPADPTDTVAGADRRQGMGAGADLAGRAARARSREGAGDRGAGQRLPRSRR
jgi:hypothetical protein